MIELAVSSTPSVTLTSGSWNLAMSSGSSVGHFCGKSDAEMSASAMPMFMYPNTASADPPKRVIPLMPRAICEV